MAPPIKVTNRHDTTKGGEKLSLAQYQCNVVDDHVECTPFVREFVREGRRLVETTQKLDPSAG